MQTAETLQRRVAYVQGLSSSKGAWQVQEVPAAACGWMNVEPLVGMHSHQASEWMLRESPSQITLHPPIPVLVCDLHELVRIVRVEPECKVGEINQLVTVALYRDIPASELPSGC